MEHNTTRKALVYWRRTWRLPRPGHLAENHLLWAKKSGILCWVRTCTYVHIRWLCIPAVRRFYYPVFQGRIERSSEENRTVTWLRNVCEMYERILSHVFFLFSFERVNRGRITSMRKFAGASNPLDTATAGSVYSQGCDVPISDVYSPNRGNIIIIRCLIKIVVVNRALLC